MFFACERFVAFVRYVKQRRRTAFRNRFEQIEHPPPVIFVETVAGFVEHEDEGAFYRSAQNKDGALFTVTERGKSFVSAAGKSAERKPLFRSRYFHIGRFSV